MVRIALFISIFLVGLCGSLEGGYRPCLSLGSRAQAQELVRVLLQEGPTVQLVAKEPFTIVGAAATKELAAGKYFLQADLGQVLLEGTPLGPQALIEAEGELPALNRQEYKGLIELTAENSQLQAVNVLALEEYLAAALPQHTLAVWPDQVLKAQAIAARTYVYYVGLANKDRAWDIEAQDQQLPYLGTGQEQDHITSQIVATKGQYLAYGDKPILALLTSSTGGRTEAALEGLGRELPYLPSRPDPDTDSPDSSWQIRLAPFIVENILEQQGHVVGQLQAVYLSPFEGTARDRTSTGRVRHLVFVGTKGSVTLSGSKAQELFNLPSTSFAISTGVPTPDSLRIPIENAFGMEIGGKNISIKVEEQQEPVYKQALVSYHGLSGNKEEKLTFTGKGRGHGMGLSGWGARGLVLENDKITTEEILAYYYPGSSLVKRAAAGK